ncbi:major facilitator superfamily protein [Helicobacter muridarum]|uniref:Major facilitator superfamily protein n=1 Tax=Helicobacter muridarum TaxID=216 RepID=A0A377PXG7_9HELI|nr:major facilitator superfamily protein [Helicobacter muridarum]
MYFLINSIAWIYIGMFIVCFGAFLTHSILNNLNNSLNQQYKGVLSGLYLSFYYTWGTFESYLPSFIFEIFGWEILIILITILSSFTSIVLYLYTRKD